jgi:PBP superfamily domain
MRKISLLVLLLLTGCAGPLRSTPAPAPVLINVALSPSLRPWITLLQSCAATSTDFVINVSEKPAYALDVSDSDLVIQFGGAPVHGYAAFLREEALVLIVNAQNPVLTLPNGKLREIYMGVITRWSEVGGDQQPIQVWTYPDGDEARRILDKVIIPVDELTPNALIAPDPQAMLEAIGDDPQAIGFVPQNWLAQSGDNVETHPLHIEQNLVEKLHQPVLAITKDEPEGVLRQLVVCMQSASQ